MRSFHNRLNFIFAFAILLALGLVARILYLQYFNDDYRAMAEEQRRSIVEIDPDRGSILDSDGNALAETVTANSLYLYPYLVEKEDRLIEFLDKGLGIKEKETRKMLESEDRSLVSKNLSSQTIDKLNRANIAGLRIETETIRYYPRGNFLSHALGFLNGESQGEYGLEAYYDQVLFGEEGHNIQDKSPLGDPIPYQRPDIKEAKKGSDIKLTIDSQLQEIVLEKGREAFEKHKPKNMSIIVMDPRNANILAMENFPNYDPNEPRQVIKDENKGKKLSEEKFTQLALERWRNFSINDSYEPGSIYKVITAASGVEEGTITRNTTFECQGLVEDIAGMTLYCHVYPDSHGIQDLDMAMANSCNPAFIQMAEELGSENMFKYLKNFGFTEPTGIDLPAEAVGLVPESVDEITESRLATMGYGHGIAVTPIQIATAISSVVNGGKLYQPKIVSQIIDKETGKAQKIEDKLIRNVISEETSNFIKEALVYGVDHGTADGAQIPGYDIGGKTGTTEKLVDGEYSPDLSVASFVGVYPAYQPEYVILVVADEAEDATSGNIVSAPVVAEIIKEIIKIRGDEPTRPYELEELGLDPENPYIDENESEENEINETEAQYSEEYEEDQAYPEEEYWEDQQNDEDYEENNYDELNEDYETD